jgi:hypothetical protein
LLKAIEDARALAIRGDFGADLFELVQQARELHEIALEALAGEPIPVAKSRELAEVIGRKVAEVEAMLAERKPPGALH